MPGSYEMLAKVGSNCGRMRAVTSSMCCLALLISGCVTADFREPVSNFTSGMATANAAINSYFVGMNDFERRLYLQRALRDPTMRVEVVDASGRRTGLLPYFSAESIKARTDAVALLTVYGERLAALAGADAPARFNSGSTVLGANLGGLANTFSGLSGGGDATAARYTGPIGQIVGIFGEMILERQRGRALKRAVNEGAPAVELILGQLELDLDGVVKPLRDVGIAQELSSAALDYNRRRPTMSTADRRQALAEIDALAAGYQAAVTSNPGEAVDGIRDAHAALVTFANSSRKPQDLAALVGAIETFNNRLKPLAASLVALKEADDV